MLGLGLTTLACNLQKESGRIDFDIHTGDGISSFITILSALIIHFALSYIVFANDYKVKQKHAKVLVIIYVISIIIVAFASLS